MLRPRWIAIPPAILLELVCAVQLLSEPLSPLLLAVVALQHAGACGVFGWACLPNGDDVAHRPRQLLAGAVAFLGFPGFGMVAILSGCLAGTLVTQDRAPRTTTIEIGNEAPSIDERETDVRIALEVQPLADLLHGDDPDLKRGAIDALAASRRYRAAPILQSLLHDPDPEIRLYASIRLGSLEDEMASDIQAARLAVDDPQAGAPAYEHEARVYLEYAECGLLDNTTGRHYLALAQQAYERAGQLEPDQHTLALAIGRACLTRDELDCARQYFERAAEGEDLQVEVHLALMELAYRRGALDELAARASATLSILPAQHAQTALVQWWAGAA